MNDDNSYNGGQKEGHKYNKYRNQKHVQNKKQQIDYDFGSHYHSGFGGSGGYEHHHNYGPSDHRVDVSGYGSFEQQQFMGMPKQGAYVH